jgi:hypothetical protein
VSSHRSQPGETAAGPSCSGTVVLELGPGAGALVLQVPAALADAEIDISSAGNVEFRTHALVRPRHLAGGTVHAAVYPDLPPGGYVIWPSPGVPGICVTIVAGAVTTASLPAAG